MAKIRMLREVTRELLEQAQVNEMTESAVYTRLAKMTGHGEIKALLLQLAAEEEAHAEKWKEFTGLSPRPKKHIVFWYAFLGRALGIRFALRQAEKREEKTSVHYEGLSHEVPGARGFAQEEVQHRQQILQILSKKK